MSAADTIRAWLRATIDAKGLNVSDWARRAAVNKSTIFRALKDDYQFVTSSSTLAKLAAAAEVDPPEIAGARESQVAPLFLVVRHRVQAGLWYEVDEGRDQVLGTFPVVPDPRYAGCPQWLEHVTGDSANLKIPDGGYAHVVDAIAIRYEPVDGDWVVVERRRNGGFLRERTVKQVEVVPGGTVRLWPRSTNTRWSEPIDLLAGTGPDEEVEVEIVCKVIGSYVPF